jgi:hypothetical protein
MNHQPARINPDTKPALVLAMLACAGLASVSFVLSFAGLSAIAPWAAVPPRLAALVPLFIDVAILVYTYSALAATARAESAVRAWTWVALWTLVSSAANAAHAWSFGPGGWQGIVGAGLAALFPIGTLLAMHEIASRMIARPAVEPARPAAPLHLVTVPEDWTERLAARRHPEDPKATVRALRAQGLSVRAIAERVGMAKSTVHAIVRQEAAA